MVWAALFVSLFWTLYLLSLLPSIMLSVFLKWHSLSQCHFPSSFLFSKEGEEASEVDGIMRGKAERGKKNDFQVNLSPSRSGRHLNLLLSHISNTYPGGREAFLADLGASEDSASVAERGGVDSVATAAFLAQKVTQVHLNHQRVSWSSCGLPPCSPFVSFLFSFIIRGMAEGANGNRVGETCNVHAEFLTFSCGLVRNALRLILSIPLKGSRCTRSPRKQCWSTPERSASSSPP